MKISKGEFLENENTPILFLGMSGVGKTHLSSLLAASGLPVYSCDYEIGTKFLAPEIRKKLGVKEKVTMENISLISDLVGQLGDERQGGLPLKEFKKRQALYKKAECASLVEALSFIDQKENLIIDSTGSLCEVVDAAPVEAIGQKTLFVYLKASTEDEQELIERARAYPKPLYFPESHLEEWINTYLTEQNLRDVSDIPPNDFSKWVFDKLLESRRPKYQALADKYGITVPAAQMRDVKSKNDFIEKIGSYL